MATLTIGDFSKALSGSLGNAFLQQQYANQYYTTFTADSSYDYAAALSGAIGEKAKKLKPNDDRSDDERWLDSRVDEICVKL